MLLHRWVLNCLKAISELNQAFFVDQKSQLTVWIFVTIFVK